MDTWRVTPQLTINYGLRYDTTFGLFQASGVNQFYNPAVQTIKGLQLPLHYGVPNDYQTAFAPRLGIAYNPDRIEDLVIRRDGLHAEQVFPHLVYRAPGPSTLLPQ